MATERLQERAAMGGKVQGSTIMGVKVLGRVSRNGRRYLPEAIAKAAPKYEGVRVNIDHAAGGHSASYRDRIGRLANVRVTEGGLVADLQVNPRHPHGEQLLWDAEHSPASCGLSHNVSGTVTRKGNEVIVESIDEVHSVDVVADPATTSSLFESAGSAAPDAKLKAAYRQAIGDAFDDETLDTKATMKRIRALLKAYDKAVDAGLVPQPPVAGDEAAAEDSLTTEEFAGVLTDYPIVPDRTFHMDRFVRQILGG